MDFKEEIQKKLKDLSEEEISQFLIKFDPQFLEEKIEEKVIAPLDIRISNNLEILSKKSCDYGIRLATSVNLLNQASTFINLANSLLGNNSLVNINSLLRNALEYIARGFIINFDDDSYQEFKRLEYKENKDNKKDKDNDKNKDKDKVKDSSVTVTIKKFRKKLKDINKELFGNYSNRQLDILIDMYDNLCLYIHPTVISNLITEIERNHDDDIFILITKVNIDFIKVILCSCICYLVNDNEFSIDYGYLILKYLIMLSNTDLNKYTKENLEKYYDMIYLDTNIKYIQNNRKKLIRFKKDLNEAIKFLNDNSFYFIEKILKLIE